MNTLSILNNSSFKHFFFPFKCKSFSYEGEKKKTVCLSNVFLHLDFYVEKKGKEKGIENNSKNCSFLGSIHTLFYRQNVYI